MSKPLVIDLYCGLGGWTDGFLSEGFRAVGFDIERHNYGTGGYPGELVLQDARTIDGRRFREACVIVASPPCQEFSYRAMPWKLGKALAPKDVNQPEPEWWSKAESEMDTRELADWRSWQEMNPLPPPDMSLFEACFRIQREASTAAGRRIPLVVENVTGAQKYCGKAAARYGSFYLWGDVEVVGDRILCGQPRFGAETLKVPRYRGDKVGISWSGYGKEGYTRPSFDGTAARQLNGIKQGGDWFAPGEEWQKASGREAARQLNCNTTSGKGQNLDGRKVNAYQEGAEIPKGTGKTSWFFGNTKHEMRQSNARKAASAKIAKIPLPLSRYIAQAFKP